jgi:peptidoglycan/LPS O-acetylase OafA/YrhL
MESGRTGKGPAPRARRPYWGSFDGVRAAAVLAVMLFHTGLGPFRSGFLGVDVFFVLSGFLITSLLLEEHRATGGLVLKAFYQRRVLRILPAMVTVAVGCAAIAVVSNHFVAVLEGAIAAVLFVANFWIFSNHNTYLLQQTWTLALEEQFYLLWPVLLIVALGRRWSGRTVLFVLGCAAWAAILLVPVHGPAKDVLGTYRRAAGLPLGCLLAICLPYVARVPRYFLQATCLAAAVFLTIATLTPLIPRQFFYGSPVSLAAIAAVPLVAGLTIAPPRRLDWLLTLPVARWIGRRSYGLYLWSFPITTLVLNHGHAVPLAVRIVVAFGLSFLAAELSWRFIETYFLRRKERYEELPREESPSGAASRVPTYSFLRRLTSAVVLGPDHPAAQAAAQAPEQGPPATN